MAGPRGPGCGKIDGFWSDAAADSHAVPIPAVPSRRPLPCCRHRRRPAGRATLRRQDALSGYQAMADETGHFPRGPARMFRATVWSLQGLRAAWLHVSSFRLEVYLFVVLAPLGWWLGGDGVERALLVGCLMLVLAVELLNSAIEAVIGRYGDEPHELA